MNKPKQLQNLILGNREPSLRKCFRYRGSILLLILIFFLPCCSKKESKREQTTLRLNIVQDPLTLDPRKSADFISSTIQFLLFEGLVRITPYTTVSLALADSVDISEDKRTYTFHLRNAKWSDGTIITAYDFVQTWKDVLQPDFPSSNAHLLFPIKNAEKAKQGLVPEREIGLRAVDHNTIQVYLEQPTPFFLEMVSFCVFAPIYQRLALSNSKWADEKGSGFICNGPYRLAKWKRGSEIVLEKNPYYWDAENVTLDRIHFSIIDNEMTALKMFELDELDILGLPFTGIPSDSVPSLMDKGILRTTSLPGSTICCFNLSSFPFTNLNMRKAFAFAINRQEIVDNVTQMNEEIGLHLIPKNLMQERNDPFFQDGDEEKAKHYFQKALKEMRITSDELGPITLLHASSGIYPKVAQALQEHWRRVLGVHVRLEGCEYKVFLDKLTKRDYQMGQCVWIAQYHDPMNFFERFKNKTNAKNYPNYDNPEYTNLLNESNFAQDVKTRLEILRRAEAIFVNDMPLTAIYHWNSSYLLNPSVQNLQVYPTGGFYLCGIHFKKKSDSKNDFLE